MLETWLNQTRFTGKHGQICCHLTSFSWLVADVGHFDVYPGSTNLLLNVVDLLFVVECLAASVKPFNKLLKTATYQLLQKTSSVNR